MKRLIALALPLLALPSIAGATVYIDRVSFNAAVAGVVTDDLNGFPVGLTTTIFGVDTLSSSGNPGGARISSYGNGFGNALGGANAGGGIDNFQSVKLTFGAPIYAIAFDDLDLTGGSEFANIRLTFAGGGTQLFDVSETDSDFTTAAFFGFWSGTAINSVEVWSSNLPGEAIGQRANLIDNVAISRIAQAVPEPASWAMMITGFGLIGGAMRRRKTATRALA